MHFSIRPPSAFTGAPHTGPDVFATIRRLTAKSITLLLVEQFARSALEVADQAHVIERSTLAVAGTPEELRHDQRATEAYLG